MYEYLGEKEKLSGNDSKAISHYETAKNDYLKASELFNEKAKKYPRKCQQLLVGTSQCLL